MRTVNIMGAGRNCSICYSVNREEIEGQLAAGVAVFEIVRMFGVSKSAVYRHLGAHVGPEVREALRAGDSLRVGNVLTRVVDVADAARTARINAAAAGDLTGALKAGDSELRALSVMSDRFGIDDVAVAEIIDDADALVTAVRRTITAMPAAGEVLAKELRRVEQHELAEVIANIADRAERAQRAQVAIQPASLEK